MSSSLAPLPRRHSSFDIKPADNGAADSNEAVVLVTTSAPSLSLSIFLFAGVAVIDTDAVAAKAES